MPCRLWSAKIGQDFIPQCNLLGIDYCSIHLWPDNWNTVDPVFPTTWITAHEQATAALNKPLVLEEVSDSFRSVADASYCVYCSSPGQYAMDNILR